MPKLLDQKKLNFLSVLACKNQSLLILLTKIAIGVRSGGSGGALAPPEIRATFNFSGNLSKCPYIFAEKFVTAIASPKKKNKKEKKRSTPVWTHV